MKISSPPFCIFVISTGRTGTMTLWRLFSLLPGVVAHHEPSPRVGDLNRLAYREGCAFPLWPLIIERRRELIGRAASEGKGYVETGGYMSFLLPAITAHLPDCRVIHQYRNPFDYVRSCIRRGTCCPGDESPRLEPSRSSPEAGYYGSWNPIQKNAWRWNAVNKFGMDWLPTLRREDGLALRSEDLFAGDPATISAICLLAGSAPPANSKVEELLSQRLNAQQAGDFNPPQDWKAQVWQIAGETATGLGYKR